MNNEIKNMRPIKNEKYLGNVYFNGFGVGVSATDISVTMTLGEEDIGRIIMPLGTAKSLIAELARNIDAVEDKLGKIYTIEEAGEKMKDLWE